MEMKRWAALGCTVALAVLIFALSAQSGADSKELSDAALAAAQEAGIAAFIPAWFDERAYANIRKWAHICLYASFGISVSVTVHLWSRRRLGVQMALAALLCVAYAASDELHQYFVPGRAGQWQDVFLDALGFVPVVFAVWLFLLRREKQNQNLC